MWNCHFIDISTLGWVLLAWTNVSDFVFACICKYSIFIFKIIYTVEPRLSESPLSESSVIQTLFLILKSQKTIWLSAKPSNKWKMSVWFLDLLGLSYHSTVGRKAY